jgi:hypothetical protein
MHGHHGNAVRSMHAQLGNDGKRGEETGPVEATNTKETPKKSKRGEKDATTPHERFCMSQLCKI